MVDTTPHGTGQQTDVINSKYDPDQDGLVENIELNPLAQSGSKVNLGDNNDYHVMYDGGSDTLIVTHSDSGNMWRFDADGTLSVPSAPVDNTDVARLTELDDKADTGHNHDSRYYTQAEVDSHNHDSRYYTQAEVDSLTTSGYTEGFENDFGPLSRTNNQWTRLQYSDSWGSGTYVADRSCGNTTAGEPNHSHLYDVGTSLVPGAKVAVTTGGSFSISVDTSSKVGVGPSWFITLDQSGNISTGYTVTRQYADNGAQYFRLYRWDNGTPVQLDSFLDSESADLINPRIIVTITDTGADLTFTNNSGTVVATGEMTDDTYQDGYGGVSTLINATGSFPPGSEDSFRADIFELEP